MDRHRRVPVAKRPFGVSIMMAGGLKGYSGCNNMSDCFGIYMHTSLLSIRSIHALQQHSLESVACQYTNPLRKVSRAGLPRESAILQKQIALGGITCWLSSSQEELRGQRTKHVSFIDVYSRNMHRWVAQEGLQCRV